MTDGTHEVETDDEAASPNERVVMHQFPRLRMVEIYGGKDNEWKGWYNLILDLSAEPGDNKSIQGPIDPATSKQLLLLPNIVTGA